MSLHDRRSAARPEPDGPMLDVARYVAGYTVDSREAFDTARYMLLDSLACAALAMDHEACVRHLGPLVPGADMKGGARVPFTHHELDPVQAAYNIGVQVRWLDFNDTWLAAEWGHPSDNLGAILAVADYLGRRAEADGGTPMTVRVSVGSLLGIVGIVLVFGSEFAKMGGDRDTALGAVMRHLVEESPTTAADIAAALTNARARAERTTPPLPEAPSSSREPEAEGSTSGEGESATPPPALERARVPAPPPGTADDERIVHARLATATSPSESVPAA